MLLMEDRKLLDAYRRGDSEALEAVYRHYVARVERLMRSGFTFTSAGKTFRFVGFGSAFERQEVVQESFIRAFGERARIGYSGLKPFGPYLLGIARNLIIDEFRRRRREMSLFVSEDGEGVSLDGVDQALMEQTPVGDWARKLPTPERLAAQRQTNALMQQFTATLTPEELELVTVHFIEENSQQQTAELLETDRNAIRKQVRLLRLKLLRFMKSRGQINSLDPEELMSAMAQEA